MFHSGFGQNTVHPWGAGSIFCGSVDAKDALQPQLPYYSTFVLDSQSSCLPKYQAVGISSITLSPLFASFLVVTAVVANTLKSFDSCYFTLLRTYWRWMMRSFFSLLVCCSTRQYCRNHTETALVCLLAVAVIEYNTTHWYQLSLYYEYELSM